MPTRSVLVAAVLAATPAAAQDAPYVGHWSCAGQPLTLGPDFFDAGEGEYRIAEVSRDGDDYVLTLRNGRRYVVGMRGAMAINVFSYQTGNFADCERLQ